MVILILGNSGKKCLSVTETFGFQDLFLHVAIEDVAGRSIDYPVDSQYELFREPPYRPLKPGHMITLKINLANWYHIYGGVVDTLQQVPEPGPYSFSLPSGSYRIKAIYSSPNEQPWVKCPNYRGPVESPWIYFEVRNTPHSRAG